MMRDRMSLHLFRLLCLLLSVLAIGCGIGDEEEQEEEQEEELYNGIAVARTGNPQIPVVAIHEDGSRIAIISEENLTKIQGAVYISPNEDKFVVWLDDRGLPTQAYSSGYTMLFENYRPNKVDVAIVAPTGEIDIYRSVDIDYESRQEAGSPDGDEWFEHSPIAFGSTDTNVASAPGNQQLAKTLSLESLELYEILKIAGTGLSIAGCAIAIATTSGAILPAIALPCGAAILNVTTLLIGADNQALESSSAAFGSLAAGVGFISGDPGSYIAAAAWVTDTVAVFVEYAESDVKKSEAKVETARDTLDSGIKSGRIAQVEYVRIEPQKVYIDQFVRVTIKTISLSDLEDGWRSDLHYNGGHIVEDSFDTYSDGWGGSGSVYISFEWQTPATQGEYHFYNITIETEKGTVYNLPEVDVKVEPASKPVVVIKANPTSGPSPLTVSFDSSGTRDPDGGKLRYNWFFGDGHFSTEANPTHTYDGTIIGWYGLFEVRLVVYNENDVFSYRTLNIDLGLPNELPCAFASANPYRGEPPLKVFFDSSDSYDDDGRIVSYRWDFEDGSFSTERNPTHTFRKEGTYKVTLEVTDNHGATDTITVTVRVEIKKPEPPHNTSPTARASATPTNGTEPLEVSFDSSGSSDPDGSIVSYLWDFGDGNTSTIADPTHTFSSAKTYTVTLGVTDDDGATDTDSVRITVEAKSEPPLPSEPKILEKSAVLEKLGKIDIVNPGDATLGRLTVTVKISSFKLVDKVEFMARLNLWDLKHTGDGVYIGSWDDIIVESLLELERQSGVFVIVSWGGKGQHISEKVSITVK